jgi:hypothetical protein
VTSPYSLSNSTWANSGWTSTEPSSASPAAISSAETDGVAAAASFQNLFMQSASLQTSELPGEMTGNMPLNDPGNLAANWGGGGFSAGAAGTDKANFLTSNNWQNSNSTPVATASAASAQSQPAAQAAAPTNTDAARRVTEKKAEPRGHAKHLETKGVQSLALVTAGLPASHAAGTAVKAAAAQPGPDENADSGQNGQTAAQKVSGALAALGGPSALAGAAFALHVTTVAKQNNSGQNGADLAATPKTPATEAATSADATLPVDSSGQGGANSDLTAFAATASPAMNQLANQAGARSRPLTASSDTIAGAEGALWSESSPRLFNDSTKQAESVTPTLATAEVAEDDSGPAQPVRTVQVQLAGEGDQRVDLRLVEHAGGLSVSVRTSDSSLTRGLQDHLPELTDRLAAEHYQTQNVLPANETSNGGSSHGSSSGTSDHSQQQQAQQQQGGRQSPQGGSSSSGGEGNPRQGQQKDQAPAWWRQLATGNLSASLSGSIQSSIASPETNQ